MPSFKRTFTTGSAAIVACLIICLSQLQGCVYFHRQDFGGQRNIALADGLKSDIWISPHTRDIGIYLFCEYSRWSAPYAVRLQIWDDSKTHISIELTEIELTYEDGEIIRKPLKWRRDFQPIFEDPSDSKSNIKMMSMSGTLENLFDRHENVSIMIKGSLTKVDGEVVKFTATENFEVESATHIIPFWEAIGGV